MTFHLFMNEYILHLAGERVEEAYMVEVNYGELIEVNNRSFCIRLDLKLQP